LRTALASLLLFAVSTAAQTVSTMCQATEFVISATISDRRLIGCGEGFPDNLIWHLDRADSIAGTLDGRYTRRLTGRGAVIYMIDTGVLAAHDEFARAGGSNVVAVGNDTTLIDLSWLPPGAELRWGFGHGTSAASVAAGRQVGVAPDALVVAAPNGGTPDGYRQTLLQIIAHAHAPSTPQFSTGIINISGGLSVGDPNAPELDALIRRMTTGVDAAGNADPNGKKFLFVAAAGNLGSEQASNQCLANEAVGLYPALLGTSIDGLIAAGGIDRDNRYWAGACKGPLVEMAGPAAPNMLVASSSANDAYRLKPFESSNGTSWSAPYISGMAALLLELNPHRTPAQLEALLKASPSRVGGVPVPIFPEPPAYEGKRRSARR
jgi:membrane-anchored mycosin MYCP